MSLYFPSSTRAIKASGRRLSLFGITLALLIIIAWIGWFFQGHMTLYETSYPITFNRDSLVDNPVVRATFPSSAFEFIQQGQEATLWLETYGTNTAIPLRVQIYDILTTSEHQPIQITIWIKSPDIDTLPAGTLKGTVKIATKQVRPITLFLMETGMVSASCINPQTFTILHGYL